MQLRDHIKHGELRVQGSLYLDRFARGIGEPEEQGMVISSRGCNDVGDASHREFWIVRHGENLANDKSAADFEGRLGRRHLGRMCQQSGDQR
jgi:hypothetical protein